MSEESKSILADESSGVEAMLCPSCVTTSSSEYLVSIAGLKIYTFCLANLARFSRRISYSVLPENIDPQITSIRPLRRVSCMLFSEKTSM